MKRKPESSPLENDPVVDEVRRIRAALWREGGGTPEGFSRVTRARAKPPASARTRTIRKNSAKASKRAAAPRPKATPNRKKAA